MKGSTKVEQASLPVPEWDARITAVMLSRGDALGSYNTMYVADKSMAKAETQLRQDFVG
ncbi:MAG: hypothetical protein JO170_24890 [Verrucomicrobia bacterium]|nr:hypothetical protein [Verrucomicrobiota bacterium]